MKNRIFVDEIMKYCKDLAITRKQVKTLLPIIDALVDGSLYDYIKEMKNL